MYHFSQKVNIKTLRGSATEGYQSHTEDGVGSGGAGRTVVRDPTGDTCLSASVSLS